MRAQPTPVVLVGGRGYGRTHLANLRRLTDTGRVRVVGVCDQAPLTADELEGLGPFDSIVQSADLTPLLTRTQPSVAVISTPLHTHVPLALSAVRAGAHVLVEKPPAPSLAGFRQLTAGLAESGRVCQVGFQSFGSEAVHAVRRLVADGAIGRPVGIGGAGAWVREARYYARSPWAGHRRFKTDDGARAAVDVVDGVLTNPLAHALATALRVAGSDREQDVAAVELELYRAHDIEADDTSCVRVTTALGTKVTLAATLCAEANTAPYIFVHGEAGRITLHYTEDRILLERPGHEAERLTYPRTDLLDNLLEHLRDGTDLLSPLARSGAFTRVVESVRTAADPVRLAPGVWHPVGEGPHERRVIPGVDALTDESARRLALFSELGTPWAKATVSEAVRPH
ncbi:Gfo/Idh/MocA family protein [Streptomyces sp. NBC_00063]|uniref:Gfo/Idh/MocA family protein n=1 Tax=Streptomyces sp. NBC_00063 TaxID=2975638 RepID=UPI003D764F32